MEHFFFFAPKTCLELVPLHRNSSVEFFLTGNAPRLVSTRNGPGRTDGSTTVTGQTMTARLSMKRLHTVRSDSLDRTLIGPASTPKMGVALSIAVQ